MGRSLRVQREGLGCEMMWNIRAQIWERGRRRVCGGEERSGGSIVRGQSLSGSVRRRRGRGGMRKSTGFTLTVGMRRVWRVSGTHSVQLSV